MYAARIGKSHSAGALVKTFTCCIIVGTSDHAKLSIAEHLDDVAVTAACHKAQIRRFKLGERKIVGSDMTCYMMNRYKGLSR